MKSLIVILCKLALSLVFGVAGVSKLVDRNGTSQTLGNFGVPESLLSVASVLLPLTEILVAIAIWPAPTATWGALGCLALIVIFSGAIIWNLALGKQPDCRCFGQISAKPIGNSTLIRNGILALPALLLLIVRDEAANTSTIFSSVESQQTLVIVLGLLVLAAMAAGGWLLLNLMRQQGRLLLRLEEVERKLGLQNAYAAEGLSQPAQPVGLSVGTPAPAFNLRRLFDAGHTALTDLVKRGKPTVLVLSDPNCGPCDHLMPAVATWQKELADKVTVVVISRGDVTANENKAKSLDLRDVLLQKDYEISDQFKLYGTPSAILIDTDGNIAASGASGSEQIERLFQQAAGNVPLTPSAALPGTEAQSAPTIKVGDQAPEFALQSVVGKTVKLSEKRGKKTLLLFWNPACGFCSQMLDRLKQWEKNRNSGTPEIILVSTGTVQTNREMGLVSEILLDQSFATATLFGASGTPSAILVDEHGKIASQVGVGADAVINLAGAGQGELAAA